MTNSSSNPHAATELGNLLGGIVQGVVEAQEKLDDYARSQRARALAVPTGEVVLPPLWYTFHRVAIDLELSAEVESQGSDTRLHCRTLSPAVMGLYGHAAADNVRVRVLLAPQGPIHLQEPPAESSDDNL